MAMFTAVVDLPTPPLPEATATNRRTLISWTRSTTPSSLSSPPPADADVAAGPEWAVTTTVALVTPGMARTAVSAALRTGSIAGPRWAGTSSAKLILLCLM